jgi:inorganic triphosphatase YgiF
VYEVEQKYPVADVAALEVRLAGAAARWHGVVEQVDRYFGHPSRDFAATDEALRLRSTAEGVVITWKGPRLDATAKTRREIELPLAEAAVPAAAAAEAAVLAAAVAEAAPLPAPQATLARWTDLLEALGFRHVKVQPALTAVEGKGSALTFTIVEGKRFLLKELRPHHYRSVMCDQAPSSLQC